MTDKPTKPPCHTPDKIAYFNRQTAAVARENIKRREGKQADIYECVCGKWHLTVRHRRR